MIGQMKKYNKSLEDTPGPILIDTVPQLKVDLKGLMAYARERGVEPIDLSEEEKERFIERT